MKSCIITGGYGSSGPTDDSFSGWNLARERAAEIRSRHARSAKCDSQPRAFP